MYIPPIPPSLIGIMPPKIEVSSTTELARILSLPRRQPLNCEREKGVKGPDGKMVRRYAPEAKALIDIMTAQYTLGDRTCVCSLTRQYKEKGLTLEQGWQQFIKDVPYIKDPLFQSMWGGSKKELKSKEEKYFSALWGHPCIKEFNALQAWALWEMSQVGGIHGIIPVGGGKSLIGILAPLALPECHTAVLFGVPTQLLHYQNNYLRTREHFRVPSMMFEDPKFQGFIVEGQPTLRFVAYSRLSHKQSTILLETIAPDTIIADEAHCISSPASVRTGRVMGYLARRGAQGYTYRFLSWSGTMVKKSMKDQAHLIAHALGTCSPLPLGTDDVEAWSLVVDPSYMPDRSSTTYHQLKKAFGSGIHKSRFEHGEDIRVGMQDRLINTQGVISTRASSIDASLYIHERVAPPMPPKVEEALKNARAGLRVDGEELISPVEIAACVRNVATGFYYYWHFYDNPSDSLVEEWRAARKAYRREVRKKLEKREPHLDSPDLCKHAAMRAWSKTPYKGDLPVWKSDHWPRWAAVRDRIRYEVREEWIDDYLAQDAAKYALENKAVVWYISNAFGKRVAKLAGLPLQGGGTDAEAKILSERGDRSIVASIKAHGASRDGIQLLFHEQLIAEIPSSADIFQQLFGRLLRLGQVSDSVDTYMFMHVPENKDALRNAIELAEFSEDMTPSTQALLSANISFEL